MNKKRKFFKKKRYIFPFLLIIFLGTLFYINYYCLNKGIPRFCYASLINQLNSDTLNFKVENIKTGIGEDSYLEDIALTFNDKKNKINLHVDKIKIDFAPSISFSGIKLIDNISIDKCNFTADIAGFKNKFNGSFSIVFKRSADDLEILPFNLEINNNIIPFDKIFIRNLISLSINKEENSNNILTNVIEHLNLLLFSSQPKISFSNIDIDCKNLKKSIIEGEVKSGNFQYKQDKFEKFRSNYKIKNNIVSADKIFISKNKTEFVNIENFNFNIETGIIESSINLKSKSLILKEKLPRIYNIINEYECNVQDNSIFDLQKCKLKYSSKENRIIDLKGELSLSNTNYKNIGFKSLNGIVEYKNNKIICKKVQALTSKNEQISLTGELDLSSKRISGSYECENLFLNTVHEILNKNNIKNKLLEKIKLSSDTTISTQGYFESQFVKDKLKYSIDLKYSILGKIEYENFSFKEISGVLRKTYYDNFNFKETQFLLTNGEFIMIDNGNFNPSEKIFSAGIAIQVSNETYLKQIEKYISLEKLTIDKKGFVTCTGVMNLNFKEFDKSNINLDFFYVNPFQYSGINFSEVSGNIAYYNDNINIKKIDLKLSQSEKISISGKYNLTDKKYYIIYDANINNKQIYKIKEIGKYLKDITFLSKSNIKIMGEVSKNINFNGNLKLKTSDLKYENKLINKINLDMNFDEDFCSVNELNLLFNPKDYIKAHGIYDLKKMNFAGFFYASADASNIIKFLPKQTKKHFNNHYKFQKNKPVIISGNTNISLKDKSKMKVNFNLKHSKISFDDDIILNDADFDIQLSDSGVKIVFKKSKGSWNKIYCSDMDAILTYNYDNEKFKITDFRSKVYNGNVKLDFTNYTDIGASEIDLRIDKTDFTSLLVALGVKRENCKFGGKISVQFKNGEMWKLNDIMQIYGNLDFKIEDADLWLVPEMNKLTDIIGGTWGLKDLGKISSLTADCKLNGNNIETISLISDGDVISLEGEGKYYFADKRYLCEIQARVLSNFTKLNIISKLFSPLSWLLQTKIVGKGKDVEWIKIGIVEKATDFIGDGINETTKFIGDSISGTYNFITNKKAK